MSESHALLVDGAITADKIASGTITAERIVVSKCHRRIDISIIDARSMQAESIEFRQSEDGRQIEVFVCDTAREKLCQR